MILKVVRTYVFTAFWYKTRSVKVVQFNYMNSSVDGVL